MAQLNTVLVILSWYTSNICVLLLNKYLLGGYGFKYPVFLTLCHMCACSILAYVASLLKIYELQQIQSRKQGLKICLLSCVFCASLVLGNASLRFLPVSFTQAIGATTPFFTAFISFLVLQERESNLVYSSLLPVVIGIAMATGAEPSFHMIGFVAAVAATALRAFKSVLQGVLLTDSERLNTLSLLAYMSAIAVCLLLPVVVILEPASPAVFWTLTLQHTWFLPSLGMNASLAFFVNLTNFLVTKYTSALTLQVLGNAKGVVAAIISVAIFKNPITLTGSVGYCITVGGVVAYSQARKASRQVQLLPRATSDLPAPDDTEKQPMLEPETKQGAVLKDPLRSGGHASDPLAQLTDRRSAGESRNPSPGLNKARVLPMSSSASSSV
ncbi:hypothetical protein WJX73_002140 [Symbiochloris irregularis]|uniref:Sugar phosphate transporter domain-containing protein n=1 Tax=Symbiochloris irregularis TaxID=706552 RepID=A0AAW1P2I4_9CHLO